MKSAVLLMASVLALAACGDRDAATQNAATDTAAVNVTDSADMNMSDANMIGASAEGASAQAALRTADGSSVGTATATQTGDAIRISIAGTGMPVGVHGAHVHMVGACDAPAFETAGAHWNPTNAKHGRENPAGAHKGDLPNLDVGADGAATLAFDVPGATVRGGANALLDADGGALVIHADPDDYRTDPSGNSGDRIACGVFS